ncbi:helix-turn-helix transcriptional regulator [bacterium]|nr:helix-turn-helix transcriptional regulator [bacterium]
MVNTRKVKARYIELGLTQKIIADKIGLDYTALNLKLNNKRRLYIDEVAKLCDILQIKTAGELHDFFGIDFLLVSNIRENAKELGGV